jgi:hypothetical protein
MILWSFDRKVETINKDIFPLVKEFTKVYSRFAMDGSWTHWGSDWHVQVHKKRLYGQ